jgi:DNA ligase 1
MVGSLKCHLLDDPEKKFKVGSGLSDHERNNPPKIGDIITFKYQEMTAHGKNSFFILHKTNDVDK